MYWRRPRSPKTRNPSKLYQRLGTLDRVESPARGIRSSVLWMNGFAERDNPLHVNEQDFSALVSRRLKISKMMSPGRLRNPSSSVVIG